MELATIGIDLGKSVFHLVGLDRRGRVVLRRRLSRSRLVILTANLPRCVVGMEACSGAHHLGRALAEQGHDMRLMPPQYVRPFVKGNKNDYYGLREFMRRWPRDRNRGSGRAPAGR